ncbi:MAG: hypothetical protein ACFCAD_04580 [Pleurocapsa sp.]
MDAEQIWRQAQNENTPPEILTELTTSKDKEIRRLVASNPNTPIEILEKLGEEFPDAIVDYPVFDLLLLENPENKFVLISLARASTTSVEKLKELANYQDQDIREAVVVNNKTPADIIDSIFEKDISIKEIVAKNPHASEALLCSLAKENDYGVLYAISQRECLSEAIIEILVQCDCQAKKFYPNHRPENYSWRIRKELASNLNIRTGIINSLLEDEHHHVRAAIALREDISEEQAMMLAHDLSDLVIKKLVDNPNVSNAVKKLIAEDKEKVQKYEKIKLALEQLKDIKTPIEVVNNLIDEVPQVRLYVAGSQNISEENAFILAHDRSTEVIEKLFTNPNIPLEITKLLDKYHEYNRHYVHRKCSTFNKFGMITRYFRELSEIVIPEKIASRIAERKNNHIKRLLATNKNISIDTFNSLKQKLNFNICLGFILNINTPPEILRELATNTDSLIRQGVTEHPRVTVEILDKLKSDRNISVREKVAQSSTISPKIIEELASDSSPLVRRAIAANTKTTANILNKLKSDFSLTVRLAVAENYNTEIDTLKELLNDEIPKIVESAKDNLSKI